MTAQSSALQVVILRDGLLVGTEVFVAGQYTVGSDGAADLRLDDPNVSAAHAILYFQNGRAAIQDAGSNAVFVNGHRVNACEVRSVDEIACGPFTLKVRVLQKGASASGKVPPPELAGMFGAPAGNAAPASRAVGPSAPTTASPKHNPPPQAPSTVVSPRRGGAATAKAQESAAAPTQRATPHLRPVEVPFDDDPKTEAATLAGEFLPTAEVHSVTDEGTNTAPIAMGRAAVARAAPPPPAKAAPPPAKAQSAPKAAAPARAVAKPRASAPLSPSIPSAAEGKGAPRLFVESYWGEIRKYALSFSTQDAKGKKKIVAAEADDAQVPLFGMGLDGKQHVFAEDVGGEFAVYVPPGAALERRNQSGDFQPQSLETLEVAPDQRRFVKLGAGQAIRLSGDSDMVLVAYVQAPLPRPFANPLASLPWLAISLVLLLGSGFGAFVVFFAHIPDLSDFNSKELTPVAVRLLAPPKKEEAKKLQERIEKIKKKPKEKEPLTKVEKAIPKAVVPPETKKALKSIEKLTAAGPAMKDLLAAVDKMGSGPGAKNAKSDYKLSGLLGKQPVANAGLGSFGLGGGGGGGMGMKGAELLHGRGGGGIGALGTGNIGKGSVSGTVTHAMARSVGAQGTIDKEAVAKVINSHLHEVSSCYERALLKEPGLAGKIVLEWTITTSGSVGTAKTKSSTMKSSAVEACILTSLKTWKFPSAKGAGVVITYPFMFNSVGY